jgi:hypothetical protein
VSVDDRGVPEASCWEWHGDGTAGEDALGSHVTAMASARAMDEARPGRLSLVGELTVGRVKCRVGQGGMTLWLEGSAVCWSVGVGVAGRVGRPNADLCDLAWERVS